MTFMQKMLSFEGRLRRQDLWICTLVLIAVGFVVNIVVGMVAGAAGLAGANVASDNPEAAAAAALASMGPALMIYGIVCLVMLWPSLAIAVKRLHDRNQTGWLALILLIPFVGFLFWLINLGILDGTPGPNQYGPSPKGLGGEGAVTV